MQHPAVCSHSGTGFGKYKGSTPDSGLVRPNDACSELTREFLLQSSMLKQSWSSFPIIVEITCAPLALVNKDGTG